MSQRKCWCSFVSINFRGAICFPWVGVFHIKDFIEDSCKQISSCEVLFLSSPARYLSSIYRVHENSDALVGLLNRELALHVSSICVFDITKPQVCIVSIVVHSLAHATEKYNSFNLWCQWKSVLLLLYTLCNSLHAKVYFCCCDMCILRQEFARARSYRENESTMTVSSQVKEAHLWY